MEGSVKYLGSGTTSKLGLPKANTIINKAKRLLNSEDQDAVLVDTDRKYYDSDGNGMIWKSGGSVRLRSPGDDRVKHFHLIDEALSLASLTLEKSLGATNYDTSIGGTGGPVASIRGNDTSTGLNSMRLVRSGSNDTVSYPVGKQNDVVVTGNDTTNGVPNGSKVKVIRINDSPDAMNISTKTIKIDENDRPITTTSSIAQIHPNSNDTPFGRSVTTNRVNVSQSDMSSGGLSNTVNIDTDGARNGGEGVDYSSVATSNGDTPNGRGVSTRVVVSDQNDTVIGSGVSAKLVVGTDIDSSAGSARSVKLVLPSEVGASNGAAVVVNTIEKSTDTSRNFEPGAGVVVSSVSNVQPISNTIYNEVVVDPNDTTPKAQDGVKIVTTKNTGNVSVPRQTRSRIVSVKISDTTTFAKNHNSDVVVKNASQTPPVVAKIVESGPVSNVHIGTTVGKQIKIEQPVGDARLSTYREVYSNRRRAIMERESQGRS
jgi:hypothetical protein